MANNATRGRPKIDPTAGERIHVAFRATPKIKSQLEDAARISGRSLSQETEFRIEQSFNEQTLLEREFGSKEMVRIAHQTVAAFVGEGTTMASARGLPKIGVANWINDPDSYRAAALNVFTSLMKSSPEVEWETAALQVDALKTEMYAWLIAIGKVPPLKGGINK